MNDSNTAPVVLMVLDGFGIAPLGPGNVVTEQTAPNIFRLMREYPSTKLLAAGEAVGLPAGEDGNSEVGHLNLGAGRMVMQYLPRINLSVVDGSFFEVEAFKSAIAQVKQKNSALHLMGLVGSGGVHAYNDHLWALLQLAKKNDVQKLYLHLFTDGRDSPPNEGKMMVMKVEEELKKLGIGKIATVIGRYYAMDRDVRWERTKAAYEALTEENGVIAVSALAAIEDSYRQGITDEFIKPIQIGENRAESRIREGDAVIFYNFRVDRPRQLTKAFVLQDFERTAWVIKGFDPYETRYHAKHVRPLPVSPPFQRRVKLTDLVFVTMTEYEPGLPVEIAFPPVLLDDTLGELISKAGLKQIRIAETEKERFVTHYFNGGRDEAFPAEDRLIIPSPQVATYDLKPEMSTTEVVEAAVEELNRSAYEFYLINIACPDMVAHTGNIDATTRAVIAADLAVAKLAEVVLAKGGLLMVTADHGNAEELINLGNHSADTEHSVNPVPLIMVNSKLKSEGVKLVEGVLGDVAPTILKFLNLTIPEVMTGSSLYA